MTADLSAFFDSYYRLRPVNATFTGIHDHDDRLPDWSPVSLESALDEMRALRQSLAGAADPAPASLHDVAARDRALACAFLDIQIAEVDSRRFQRGNPSLAAGEAIFGVIGLMTRPFAPALARVEAAASRLAAIPAFLAGARRSISGAIPLRWREKTIKECEGADRLLEIGIPRWLKNEATPAAAAGRALDAAREARAAFLDVRRWLESAPEGPEQYGCGAELFDLLLARGHWSARRRSDLASEASAALDEALARLHEQAASAGGWSAVQSRLAEVHPPADAYLSTYQRLWDACRQRAIELDLVTWPDYPIRYVPIPEHTRDAAPFLYYLFYRSPAPFDRLPIHDYVVTPVEPDMPADERERRLRATNRSVMKLNHVVHHGAIGHHVQNYHAYHGESQIGRVAAVDCASRIGMFLGGSMAEGWACYATDLMEEAGFLTPDEQLAQQHARARLLARAVVDIGLHEGSLGFEQAVAVYRDRLGMPAEAAVGEACKNSMFPGTAVMYWLGTDTLHQLRRDRSRAEGPAFSLRAFHDRVLAHGSIPVPLIAGLMA